MLEVVLAVIRCQLVHKQYKYSTHSSVTAGPAMEDSLGLPIAAPMHQKETVRVAERNMHNIEASTNSIQNQSRF